MSMWLIVPLVWVGAAVVLGVALAAMIRFGASGDGEAGEADAEAEDADPASDPHGGSIADAAPDTADEREGGATVEASADLEPEAAGVVFVPAQAPRPDVVVWRPQDVVG